MLKALFVPEQLTDIQVFWQTSSAPRPALAEGLAEITIRWATHCAPKESHPIGARG